MVSASTSHLGSPVEAIAPRKCELVEESLRRKDECCFLFLKPNVLKPWIKWISTKAIETETADALAFTGDFRRKTGRLLRVLHIGNIANNAYNNGCIQRKFGIEADVLCYNYYHIMGCPEWEDGAIEEGVLALGRDQFRPDWWATSLKGWKRPSWFVQGPSALCIEYLRARNADRKVTAYWKWLILELTALRETRSAGNPTASNYVPGRLQLLSWLAGAEKRRLGLYRYWLGTAVANGVLGRESKEEAIQPSRTGWIVCLPGSG